MMIEGLLIQERLDAVRAALREVRRREVGAVPLGVGAVVAGALAWAGGLGWSMATWVVPVAVLLWGVLARWWVGRGKLADVEVARLVEAAVSELDARLLTSVAILEKPRRRHDGVGFLERRVIDEVLNVGATESWVAGVIGGRMKVATRWLQLAQYAFLGSMFWLMAVLRGEWMPRGSEVVEMKVVVERAADGAAVLGFEVKPGAAEVERDSRLVVEAKVSPVVPREARLVWGDAGGV